MSILASKLIRFRVLPSVLAAAVLLSSPWQAQAQEDKGVAEEKPYKPAREIAFLRKHFLILYFEMTTPDIPLGRNPRVPLTARSDLFVQRFIDKRIDHFVQDIRERMDRIERSLTIAEELTSPEVQKAPAQPGSGRRRQLAGEVKALSREIGDLHRSLSSVLFDIKRKEKLKPHIAEGDRFFDQEIAFVREQVERAFARITDLFFEPRNVVEVGQLQNDNLLMQLHRAQRMLKALRKRL